MVFSTWVFESETGIRMASNSQHDTHITLSNLSTAITTPKPLKSVDSTDHEALKEEIIALLQSKDTEIDYTQLLEMKNMLLKAKQIVPEKMSPNNDRQEV